MWLSRRNHTRNRNSPKSSEWLWDGEILEDAPICCRAAVTFVQRGGGHTLGPCSCRCLGIRLGLPRGGTFRKRRRWVPDFPCHSEPGLAPAAPTTSYTWSPVTALEPRCVGARERSWLGAGSGLSPALAPPLPSPGEAHAASLSLVLALGRLAGCCPPRDAAFHLQRLRPAFILIGVLTVLHVLWGLGSRKSWPQPSCIRDTQSFQSLCGGANYPRALRALTTPSPSAPVS